MHCTLPLMAELLCKHKTDFLDIYFLSPLHSQLHEMGVCFSLIFMIFFILDDADIVVCTAGSDGTVLKWSPLQVY